MSDIPPEVLEIVLSKCNNILTLIKLSRTNKSVCSLIDWQSRANSLASSKKKKNIPIHHGQTPMRLCNLLACAGCMECKKPRITKITWEFGVRFCKECLHKNTISNYHVKNWDIPNDMYTSLPHTTATLYNYHFGSYDLDFYWYPTIIKIFKDHHKMDDPVEYLKLKEERQKEEQKRLLQKRKEDQKRQKQENMCKQKERKHIVHEALKPLLKSAKLTLKHCSRSNTYKSILIVANEFPENWQQRVMEDLNVLFEQQRVLQDQKSEEENIYEKYLELTKSVVEMNLKHANQMNFNDILPNTPEKLPCTYCSIGSCAKTYSLFEMWLHIAKNHPSEFPPNDWTRWYKKQPMIHDSFICVLLQDFAFSDATSLTIEKLKGNERSIVNQLTSVLKLQYVSHRESLDSTGRQNITINKPIGWSWDPLRNMKGTRSEPFDEECDNCGDQLRKSEALYHWSGMGPMCEACVEDDEEWSGYKWETLH